MLITDLAIKNRTTVAVLVLIILLIGVSTYVTLPREAFPDVPIPYILVTTPYEGVSPEDMETSVTMKIEKELKGVKGAKEISVDPGCNIFRHLHQAEIEPTISQVLGVDGGLAISWA